MSGCATHNPSVWEPAKLQKPSQATKKLNLLPPPGQRVAIAVYNFTDQTGQFKPSESGQTLSRAVTQGATSILVEALQEAGDRNWFTVIERERLDNVLRERAVIREMRASYLGEKTVNPQALPPLLFAGLLLEGGIIGYDSSTKTGGAGGRFLGIGGSTKYREDTVTVYLRAVSVKTGEVLSSVSVRKSIASTAIGADAFRYVAFKQLIELEAGVTYNEPDQLALRQAIEEAVYSLIIEGSVQNLWCINAPAEQTTALVRDYLADLKSVENDKVKLPLQASGESATGSCATQVAMRRPATVARAIAVKPQIPAEQFPAISVQQHSPSVLPQTSSNSILPVTPKQSTKPETSIATPALVKREEKVASSAPLAAWLKSQAELASEKSQERKSLAQSDNVPASPPTAPDKPSQEPAYRAPITPQPMSVNIEMQDKDKETSVPVFGPE
jgi:curli production assembly/transport component CsgG